MGTTVGGGLHVGWLSDGKPFFLPVDLGDKKIALLAQSNKGKTYGLGCILEELVKFQRPFIATDPANNLYGLRVKPNGKPSGLEVVIIGGDHADIPFERDSGERIAEALLETPICAVIDLAFESVGSVRKFMTDFAGRLMRTKPEIPRVIVLEECPTVIPQNAFGVQAQICKAAVSKLATIGGNFGYGVIPACQRPATMDKDVLSQCEALIVMGITHKKDRTTVKEWMEAKDIGDRADAAFAELGFLKAGEAWLWWPNEDRFERFIFRKRETLHPREMKKLGLSTVQLGDSKRFVESLKASISKLTVSVSQPPPGAGRKRRGKGETTLVPGVSENPNWKRATEHITSQNNEIHSLKERIQTLENENAALSGQRQWAVSEAQKFRDFLKPDLERAHKLLSLMSENNSPDDNGHRLLSVNKSDYDIWINKAGQKGAKKMLEVILDRMRLKRSQLQTLSGVSRATFFRGLSWMKVNHLVEVTGSNPEDDVILKPLS